jgi:hypothetical protein
VALEISALIITRASDLQVIDSNADSNQLQIRPVNPTRIAERPPEPDRRALTRLLNSQG